MAILEKVQGKARALRRMFGMLSVRKTEAVLLVVMSVAYAAFEGFGLGLLMPILEYVEAGGNVDAASGSFIWEAILGFGEAIGVPVALPTLLILAFIPILLRQGVYFASSWYTATLGSRSLLRLRARGFAALVHADYGFADRLNRRGSALSFLTAQPGRASLAIIQFINLFSVAVLIVLYVALLAVLSLPLTLVAVATMTAIGFVVRGNIRSSRRYGEVLSKTTNAAYRAIGERSNALRLVKLLGQEDAETEYTVGLLRALQESQVSISVAKARLEITVDPALMLSVFVIILFGVEGLGLSLASLGLFLFVLLRLNAKAKEINLGRQNFAASLDSLLYVHAVIEDAEASRHITGGSRPFTGLEDGIVFDDVSFYYDGDESALVLDHVSLTIPKGSLVALVGRSGAGKSTLADLLPRLRDVRSGRILVDSVPIQEYDLRQLRRSTGFMGQDAILFNETILHNLKYGLEREPTSDEIDKALRESYCAEFVREMPKGVDTLVGERGVRLSGGQRQRLALARVLLQDPDILILDEPTSALDSESEQYIQEALDAMHGDKTLIVIAHRLSTVKRADQIFVLDKGRVVEQGTHASLLEKDGAYRKLFDLQMQANVTF